MPVHLAHVLQLVLPVQAAGRVPGVVDMIMKHIDMHTIIFTDKCNGEFDVQSNYLNVLFTKASCLPNSHFCSHLLSQSESIICQDRPSRL